MNVNQSVRPFTLNHSIAVADGDIQESLLDIALRKINGNSGNSYATYSLSRHIGIGELQGVSSFFAPESLSMIAPEEINERFTHVFLIMQDQLRADFRNLPWEAATQFLQQIRLPVIVFGLGANAVLTRAKDLIAQLSPEMTRFFSVLSHRSQSIGIRGDYTAEVLDRIGVSNYAIVGCPSLYEAGPDRVVARAQYDPAAAIAATGLFSSPHENIHFFLQDERAFIHSLFEGDAPSREDLRAIDSSYPLYRSSALTARFKGRMHFFVNMREWKEGLRGKFMLAAGNRVHGSMVAMNVGIPALCTNGDVRSAEMCKLAGIPHFPGHCCFEYAPEALCEMSDPSQANARYGALYANFRQWLTNLGIACAYSEDEIVWPIIDVPRRHPLVGLEVLSNALLNA